MHPQSKVFFLSGEPTPQHNHVNCDSYLGETMAMAPPQCFGVLLQVSFLWLGCFLILAFSDIVQIRGNISSSTLSLSLSLFTDMPLMCTFCFPPLLSVPPTPPSFIFCWTFTISNPPLPSANIMCAINLRYTSIPSFLPFYFIPFSSPPFLFYTASAIIHPFVFCLCSSVTAVRLPDGLSFVVYEFWDGEEEWKRWVCNRIWLNV